MARTRVNRGADATRRVRTMANGMVTAARLGKPWQPDGPAPPPTNAGSLVPADAIVEAYRQLVAGEQPPKSKRLTLAIQHAAVQGNIDLSDTHADVGLSFDDCRIDSLAIERADIRSLSLLRCLLADGMHAREVRISRNLKVEDSRLATIDLDDARIDGPLRVLGESMVSRAFTLRSATIAGPFLCQDSELVGYEGRAIVADGARVGGTVSFARTRANGTISLADAVVSGALDCGDALLDGAGHPALQADRATITGGAKLGPLEARGELALPHARLGGNVSCAGALSKNQSSGEALLMDGAVVQGDVYFRHLHSTGTVRLIGVEIHGEAHFDDTVLDGVGGCALNADNVYVSEVLWLGPELETKGTVRLRGARVVGQLACEESILRQGTIDGGRPVSTVLDLSCGHVGQLFKWTGVTAQGGVTLRLAHVSVLHGRPPGWDAEPLRRWGWRRADADRASACHEAMTYRLDGFTYDQMTVVNDPSNSWAGDGPVWKRLVRWLDGERSGSLQPYFQLARVYRAAGHDTEAAHVLFHGHKKRAGWTRKPLWWVGYGYRQRYALLAAVALLVLAWGLLEWQREAFVPTDTVLALGADAEVAGATALAPQVIEPDQVAERCRDSDVRYPCLYTSAYSFETVVPLVSLGQHDAWQLDLEVVPPWFRPAFWVMTLFGWAIAVLVAASFTGAVRKE